MRYHEIPAFTRLEEAQQTLEWMCARRERGEDSLVGSCGYSWHLSHQFGAIGYDLARIYWKQGIMTEAIQALLQFGFEARNLHRVEAKVRLVMMPLYGFSKSSAFRKKEFYENVSS